MDITEELSSHTRVKYDKPKHQMKQKQSDMYRVISRERWFMIPRAFTTEKRLCWDVKTYVKVLQQNSFENFSLCCYIK